MTQFLGAIGDEAREALLGLGRRRRFAAGTTIVHEHDDSSSVLVILAGEVATSTLGDEGREIILGIRGPGDLVGELAALRGEPRSATLKARSDVEVLAVPAADFRTFLRTVPDAAVVVLDNVIDRLWEADAQRRELASVDVVGRVARRLLELGERFGSDEHDGRIEVAVTHDELAAWVGASREATTKALATLRRIGAVETHRGQVTLLDRDALRRRGGAPGPT
jgi:CRP/FNR family transcriptional regulator, cyclic AMP receptor protein